MPRLPRHAGGGRRADAGRATPTEVRAALTAGADVVKMFPASSVGGPAHIRALRSVLPDVAFCPTGGVEPGNVAAYLAAGAAFVGMGGALVDERSIAAGDRGCDRGGGAACARHTMTMDLLCMGEPMLEFNQLPPQPDGTRHYLEGHGGDTSNAAIAAARQGARVGYITALGQDMPGDSFMDLWAREGVDASTVLRTDRWLTGVYFVTHDDPRAPLPALPHELGGCDVFARRPARRRSRRARMFYVSGISQGISDSAADAVFAAIDIARRNGAKGCV